MPFAALERPALGLSLLQARLQRDGTRCDARYLGFAYADFVGPEVYRWIQGEIPYVAFAGDWSFTHALFGERPRSDAEYVHAILRSKWQLSEEAVARVLRVRRYAEPFLNHCLAAIPWQAYDVVGFTSTFEQNIASLALAKRVKRAFPNVAIVFGGANWEGEMGFEFHEQLSFVDYVCPGEADESFPALLDCIAEGGNPADVAGIVFRTAEASVATEPAGPINDLDRLPFSNYDDFFTDLEESECGADITPLPLLETSRGCWWGAKHHCTFCGLNGQTMAFRSKSAERVVEEIRYLRDRYGAQTVSVVDNILDMRYFKTLLPRLAEEGMEVKLFYEVKANLSHDQIRQLGEAGIRHIQPGLESFSDHVLSLMRKGTTALQNIQLLKWCREFGIRPEWNFLYGFPGEEPGDYDAMLPLLRAIRFLDPPGAYGPVRLDRFSPYHADPGAFGMTRIRPLAPYRFLYPFDSASLMRAAYYFEYDYAEPRDVEAYTGAVLELVRAWMDTGPQGGLWLFSASDGSTRLVREDGAGSSQMVNLESWQAAAYAACDRARTAASLARLPELADVDSGDLKSFLDWCISHGLMVTNGGRYLSLAVHSPARIEPSEHVKKARLAAQ